MRSRNSRRSLAVRILLECLLGGCLLVLSQPGSAQRLEITEGPRPAADEPLVQQGLEVEPARLVTPISVTGRIVAPDGSAVPGARVRLDHELPETRETVTDERGLYRFDRLEAYSGRLSVLARGFAVATTPISELAWPSELSGSVELSNLVLEQGVTVEGLVVDSRGDPIAGAVVYREGWSREESAVEAEPVESRATTDSAGRFVLPPLLTAEEALAGEQLWAEAEGYLHFWRRTRAVELEPGHFRLEAPIRLERMAQVEVRVVDRAGRGVARATVSCSDRERYGLIVPVSTDTDGRTSCTGLHIGAFVEVSARAPFHYPASQRLQTSSDGSEVEMVLEDYRAGEVEYRVTDLEGRPLDRGVAYLESTSRENNGGAVESSDWTDADGRKLFREVPSGEYRVFAEHHRCGRSEVATISVEDGRRTRIAASLECQSPAELEAVSEPITATVVDESGGPVVGARVLLFSKEVASTDEAGGLSLAVAESGLVHLRIEAPGRATWAAWVSQRDPRELGEIVLEAGQALTVHLDGAPAGLTVVVTAMHEERETVVEGRRVGDSYLLERLASGRHRIRAAAGGLEAGPEVVEVVPAEVLPVVELRFPTAVEVEGTVSLDGEAPGWGLVTLSSLDPAGEYRGAANLEMDGSWKMAAVPGIPLRLDVEIEGGRAVREIDPSATESIAIDLLTGNLVGVVVDAEGKGVPGLELTAHPPGATDHSPVRLVTTDREGHFRLGALLEGQWRLVAREGTGFLLLDDVRVQGGVTTDVILQTRERPR